MVETDARVEAELLVQADIALGENAVVVGAPTFVLKEGVRRNIEILLALTDVAPDIAAKCQRVFVGNLFVHLHFCFRPTPATDVVVDDAALRGGRDHVEKGKVGVPPVPIVVGVGLHVPPIAELCRISEIDECLAVGLPRSAVVKWGARVG